MRAIPAVLLALTVFFSCEHKTVTRSVTPEPPAVRTDSPDTYHPGQEWKLAWSDEFDADTLDTSVWNYDLGGDGWGNSELQTYTSNSENISLSNGRLIISALATGKAGAPFTSARIHTKDKYSFRYGLVAARIRFPYGKGVWPAFWMMGRNFDEVGWPYCGEIDIAELTGGGELGDRVVYGTVHWYSEETYREVTAGQTEMLEGASRFADDFHVFWAVWDGQMIHIGFNDREYYAIDIHRHRKEMAAFHQPFFILLNLAIGGRLTGIFEPSAVTAPMPQTMEVDWVRVYKPKP